MTDLPQRKEIRLADWDYRTPGFYFITMCTQDRRLLFTDKRLAEILANTWTFMPSQPSGAHICCDEWVVMPDHFHGIIEIVDYPAGYLEADLNKAGPAPGSIGALVGSCKGLVTKRVKNVLKMGVTNFRVWQRGYWDQIIRDDRHLENVRQYIRNNPLRWAEKRDNLDSMLQTMRYVDGP